MAFLAAIPAALGGLFGGGAAAAGGAAAGAASGGLSFGNVLGAAGSILSGVSGLTAGIYQGKVAAMNAKIAEENAVRAFERSQQEQIDQDRQTAAMIGQQEAIQSASGTTTTGRSNLLVRKAAARLGRQDAFNVREAGRMEAYGFNTDAANFRAQGAQARMGGFNSLLGGFIGAGQSLIGGSRSSRRSFNDPWAGLRARTL